MSNRGRLAPEVEDAKAETPRQVDPQPTLIPAQASTSESTALLPLKSRPAATTPLSLHLVSQIALYPLPFTETACGSGLEARERHQGQAVHQVHQRLRRHGAHARDQGPAGRPAYLRRRRQPQGDAPGSQPLALPVQAQVLGGQGAKKGVEGECSRLWWLCFPAK